MNQLHTDFDAFVEDSTISTREMEQSISTVTVCFQIFPIRLTYQKCHFLGPSHTEESFSLQPTRPTFLERRH
jgi:hypothetical protein